MLATDTERCVYRKRAVWSTDEIWKRHQLHEADYLSGRNSCGAVVAQCDGSGPALALIKRKTLSINGARSSYDHFNGAFCPAKNRNEIPDTTNELSTYCPVSISYSLFHHLFSTKASSSISSALFYRVESVVILHRHQFIRKWPNIEHRRIMNLFGLLDVHSHSHPFMEIDSFIYNTFIVS